MKNYWDVGNDGVLPLKATDKQPTFVDEPDDSKFFTDSSNSKHQKLNPLDQIYGGTKSSSPQKGQSSTTGPQDKNYISDTKHTSVIPMIGSTESYRDTVSNTINLFPVTKGNDKKPNLMLQSDIRLSYDKIRLSSELIPKAQIAEPVQSYYRIKATINQALNLELKPRLRCLVGNNAGESIPLTTTVYHVILIIVRTYSILWEKVN
jgi:hypothetical protein